jgi:hypothetical protein
MSPWFLFEAGALSKSIESSRVIPYCLGLRVEDVQGPLSRFQGVPANEVGTRRVVESINGVVENRRSESDIQHWFERLWPHLRDELEGIPVSLLRVPSQIQVKHILCAATPQFRNWERNAIMKSQNCIIPVRLHAFVESVLPSFATRSVASGSRRSDEATNSNQLCSEAD